MLNKLIHIIDIDNQNIKINNYQWLMNLLLHGDHGNPDSKVHGAKMGPPVSCRPQMGPMMAPWTLLSGNS